MVVKMMKNDDDNAQLVLVPLELFGGSYNSHNLFYLMCSTTQTLTRAMV